MKRSHLITVLEASRICGLTPRQIRGLIDRGEVAGVITGTVRRTYRVALFSVYRHVLGYPAEEAMRLVAAHLGEIDSNVGRSLRGLSDRQRLGLRNRQGQSEASSPRRSADRGTAKQDSRRRQQLCATSRQDETADQDPIVAEWSRWCGKLSRELAG